MAKKRVSGRKRIRDGGTWVGLAARFEDELWTASIYDGEEIVAAAVHVRRERAMRAALEDALERGTPAAILVEPGVDAAALGPMPVAVARTGGEHDELIERFHADVRAYERTAKEQEDPGLDEAAAFATFLDTSSLVVTALEGERERTFMARIGGAGGAADRIVLIWAGARPAIVVGTSDDARELYDAAATGAAPACASMGVAFVPEPDVAKAMTRALRRTGWRHRVMPCMRVTARDGRVVDAGPRDMRALTGVLEALIAAGLASAARGRLGAGDVEVTPRPGLAIRWCLGDEDTAASPLH